jgi:hypothetical protein
MTKAVSAFFWRRVGRPGCDSGRLFKLSSGWRLSGAAVFSDGPLPCHLQYEVMTNTAFRTKTATVLGYLGKKAIDIEIQSTGTGHWRINGERRADVTGCLDVDLGFTPATNLIPLRRLALKVGQHAQAPAAYLAFPRLQLTKLPHRYERVGRTEYAYEAPTVGYAATLRVSSSGAVIRYPRLFELVSFA